MNAIKLTAAAAAFACAASSSFGWTETGRLSLSMQTADARPRLLVRPYPGTLWHAGYVADTSGYPWYAVRAYYNGGPWTYGYADWNDYAKRNGIGCVPGSLVKGGDGIMYVCQ